MAKKKAGKSGKTQGAVGPRPGQLTAYVVTEHALEIVKGEQRREWMDALPDRFAYRCLPLLIANQAGWDLLCPTGFRARWNGKQDLDGITFKWDDEQPPTVASHFGNGVLTFTPGYLFRTPKDHNIWVKGAPLGYCRAGLRARRSPIFLCTKKRSAQWPTLL